MLVSGILGLNYNFTTTLWHTKKQLAQHPMAAIRKVNAWALNSMRENTRKQVRSSPANEEPRSDLERMFVEVPMIRYSHSSEA